MSQHSHEHPEMYVPHHEYHEVQDSSDEQEKPIHGAGSVCPIEMCKKCFEEDNK